jgi:hypothetical protein
LLVFYLRAVCPHYLLLADDRFLFGSVGAFTTYAPEPAASFSVSICNDIIVVCKNTLSTGHDKNNNRFLACLPACLSHHVYHNSQRPEKGAHLLLAFRGFVNYFTVHGIKIFHLNF